MRILINVSTLRNGGGLQVGLNLVKHCLEYSENDIDFFYLINNHFLSLVEHKSDKCFLVDDYPSNILNFKNRNKIKSFIQNLKPDLVYSVGAPSYLNIKNEVIRLTNPWIIYKDQIAYKKISKQEQLKLKLNIYLKKFFLKKTKYVITQTEDAKINIISNLNKEIENVFVVPNVYSYNLEKYKKSNPIKDYSGTINILVFSALYFHKNIDLCIKIAQILKKESIHHIKFILTLPNDQYNLFNHEIKRLGLDEYFVNKRKVALEDIPSLYEESHILFLPTLLEVFSVTFLEAMIFKVPIITTDLSFNRDVCRDAALYFNDYFEGKDVLDKINYLIKNDKVRNDIIEKGNVIINQYKSNNDTYKEHIQILKDIYYNIENKIKA